MINNIELFIYICIFYDDLVIQIKYVGYTYIDVTIWKSYKIIAFWKICSDGYIMQFKYDENIFTRYTLKPFLLDKSLWL